MHLKTEYLQLLYPMVWSLGILNSEKNRYAEIFIQNDGINTILKLVEQYGLLADEFDEELESVVTYTFTSSCYDQDREYQTLKPIMQYL